MLHSCLHVTIRNGPTPIQLFLRPRTRAPISDGAVKMAFGMLL